MAEGEKMEQKEKKNYLLAFWRVVYPLLMYFVITLIVQIPFTMVYSVAAMQEAGNDLVRMQEILMEKTLANALPPMLVAIVITVPIVLLLMKKDKKKEEAKLGKTIFGKPTAVQWILVAVIAIAYCIGGNNLITFSKISEIFPGFGEIAHALYSSGFFLQLITIGIGAPIVEELLFRGLVHRRIREYSNARVAMILSALIFGIYHMNVVQGIYAFGLGLLLSYAYEKFKSIWAPILFHAAANCTSLILVQSGLAQTLYDNSVVAWIVTIICIVIFAGVLFLLKPMKLEENKA